jgi:competence protein ComEC
VAAWFALPSRWQWQALIAAMLGVALAAFALLRRDGALPHLRHALITMALMVAAGCGVVWAKSGSWARCPFRTPWRPNSTRWCWARRQPAEGNRAWCWLREPGTGRAIKVRIALLARADNPAAVEGAIIRLRARLMPPRRGCRGL